MGHSGLRFIATDTLYANICTKNSFSYPVTLTFDLKIALSATTAVDNLSSKFEHCTVFHLLFTGEHGTNRQTDGRDIMCNVAPTAGGLHNKCLKKSVFSAAIYVRLVVNNNNNKLIL